MSSRFAPHEESGPRRNCSCSACQQWRMDSAPGPTAIEESPVSAITGPGREFWRLIDAHWSQQDQASLTIKGFQFLAGKSGEIIAGEAYIAWLRSSPEPGR